MKGDVITCSKCNNLFDRRSPCKHCLQIEKEVIYQILENMEKNEGRGPVRGLNIYFEKEFEAVQFVKSKYYADKYGVMGMPGCDSMVKSVTRESLTPNIYYDVAEYEEVNHTKVSLTRKERIKLELSALSKDELIKKLMEK